MWGRESQKQCPAADGAHFSPSLHPYSQKTALTLTLTSGAVFHFIIQMKRILGFPLKGKSQKPIILILLNVLGLAGFRKI